MTIDFTKTIQVCYCKRGMTRWVTGVVSSVSLAEETFDDTDPKTGELRKGVIMNILFATQLGGVTINDAFGFGADNWRYKEKCCEQCRFASKEGGDIVPYGSTTCTTPEGWVCEHGEMEDAENPYDDTQGGKECKYHEFIEE